VREQGDDASAPRSDETLGLRPEDTTAAGSAVDELETEPPVRDWDRYRFEGYIGGGGMGRVFRAFDPALNRRVALKFIRGDDPVLVQRFKQEARAQAQVDHDRVCRVYEVGEVQRHPYIAMQFVDGQPLDLAAREMSLEQKLVVCREAAEALHAAHRTGLIHRDIKPSNIMVERTETAGFRPFVMDFGLARDPGSAGVTMTGVIVGTPHYMPPEQAVGKTLDRRADVYGLGATLYEILAGRRPFRGDSPTMILMQVLQDVPESLSRLDPAVPADVEAIVMKCLRKDPRERYASARELADDLGRYLDGEPVVARPTGLLYRLRMKAAKNKLAVVIGVTAVLSLTGALAWGGYTRWTAARRAQLAQSFGQQVERIEALARYSHTIPLHDIRPERQRIGSMMEQIETRMGEVGRLARGPGHYALGRGSMALDDLKGARNHLETAWRQGYRTPEVSYALGRVLGEQYSRELQEAQQIADDARRGERIATIERELRDPARRYLEDGRGLETESPAFVEALIAFYEGNLDDALGKAREAFASAGWMYEAKELEGDVYRTRADDRGNRGDHDGAMQDYALAGEAYRAAAAVGESDPGVHASRCRLGWAMMRMELRARAGDVRPYYDAGVRGCEDALTADPGHVDAMVLLAKLDNRIGEYANARGEDPSPSLRAAIDWAERALDADADRADALTGLGYANLELARYAWKHGEDPLPEVEAAIEAYERALELDPVDLVATLNDAGLAFKEKGQVLDDRGEDPRPSLQKAVEAFGRALEISPDELSARTNLGVVHFKIAQVPGADHEGKHEHLSLAIEAFEQALRVSPEQMVVQYQLGRAYSMLGEFEGRRGEDPRPLLERSAEAYRRALEIGPDSAYRAHFLNGIGSALEALAWHEARRGGDPRPRFEQAIEAYRDSIRTDSNLVFPRGNLCNVFVERARWRPDGSDRAADLAEAIAACRAALSIKPDYAWAYVSLGEAQRQRGSLDEARRSLEKAIEINPALAEARIAMARLLTDESRRSGPSGKKALETARGHLEVALGLDPESLETQLAMGSLMAVEAEFDSDREARLETLARARAAFERVLAAEPVLPPEYASVWERIAGLIRDTPQG